MTAYKSLLYLIVEAGLFALYVPLKLLRTGPRIESGPISWLAIPLWLIGSLVILACFWSFTFTGRGTPVPRRPAKGIGDHWSLSLCAKSDLCGRATGFSGTLLMVWILGATDLRSVRVYWCSLFRYLLRGTNLEKKIWGDLRRVS
jgi:hypothetical protein